MPLLITATQRLSQVDNTDRSGSYTSNNITPTPGKLLLVAIHWSPQTGGAAPSTLTGLGCTWTPLQTQVYNNRGVQLWWGIPTLSSGTLVIGGFSGTFNSLAFNVTEFNNTHPSSPIVQSQKNLVTGANTSGSVTLSAFEKAENATYGCITRKDTGVTPGSGFSSLYNTSADNIAGLNSMWKNTNDTSVDWSWTSSGGGESNMIACEIRQYEDLGGSSPIFFGNTAIA